ncbi:hypothetical protein TNCV_2285291 [Trichonephila clavipes]|nr:hypothetical protein TNCV_2285291 [Trichonephila clavipes]
MKVGSIGIDSRAEYKRISSHSHSEATCLTFRPRFSPWWPTCLHRTGKYSGGRSRLPHGGPPHDPNRYINDSLKSHLSGPVPHLSFRGKFCHLAKEVSSSSRTSVKFLKQAF